MTDHEIVLAIQDILDGVNWTPDTLSEIADLLTNNGYRIHDTNETDCEYRDATDEPWAK